MALLLHEHAAEAGRMAPRVAICHERDGECDERESAMKDLINTKEVRDTETLLCHLGRAPAEHAGMANVPIYGGSTILSDTLEDRDVRNKDNPSYGRFGTPLSRVLEAALCKLVNFRSILFPSGQSACSHSLLACLKAGDDVLISDGAFTRRLELSRTLQCAFQGW